MGREGVIEGKGRGRSPWRRREGTQVKVGGRRRDCMRREMERGEDRRGGRDLISEFTLQVGQD
jgi:hypothetical protein